jgi:diguanylate cyclase (GGDEF)-like protein/PAS domain S-box-containing protein
MNETLTFLRKASERTKSTLYRHLLLGFLVGLLLPAFALLMEAGALRLSPTPATFIRLHLSNPTHFLLYTIPLGLSLFVGYWSLQIAHHKMQFRAIKNAERTLRAIVHSAHDGILTVDQAGCITSFNRSCEHLFGYSQEEIMGEPVDSILPAFFPFEAEHLDLDGDSLQQLDMETIAMQKSGSIVPVEIAASTVPDSDNSICTLIVRGITERKQSEEEIRTLAYQDVLTGLANRRLFEDRLQVALHQATERKRQLGVLFLDLDRFKYINDSLGHRCGDILLAQVSRRLLDCIRRGDTVARTGGDEFVILLPEIVGFHDIERVAERIVEAMQPVFTIDEQEVYVTFSVGGSTFPEGGTTAEALLQNADVALYRAKQEGRNCYRLFQLEMMEQVQQTLTMETNLRRALENEEFLVYYQPQVEIVTGNIVGTEALVRWQHPESGMISPGYFIPLAEETGLIMEIGNWVMRQACAQTRMWQQMGFPHLHASVNVSLRQLHEADFLDNVWQILAETGLEPQHLDIEITESIAMEQLDVMLPILHVLKEMGVQLSMDDFGTGYSSLNYLKHLPIHKVKMDQSFVRSLTVDTRDAAIAKSILTMAHSLHLKVVAEGVETAEQLHFLAHQNCDYIQGHLFSPPVCAADLEALLFSSSEGGQAEAA